jgi:hypothetical protein
MHCSASFADSFQIRASFDGSLVAEGGGFGPTQGGGADAGEELGDRPPPVLRRDCSSGRATKPGKLVLESAQAALAPPARGCLGRP